MHPEAVSAAASKKAGVLTRCLAHCAPLARHPGRMASDAARVYTKSRWGAYDAYVLTLTRQLSVGELDLFAFPQNTWGGENMLIYLLSAVLGLAVHNPCEPHVESVGHLVQWAISCCCGAPAC